MGNLISQLGPARKEYRTTISKGENTPSTASYPMSSPTRHLQKSPPVEYILPRGTHPEKRKVHPTGEPSTLSLLPDPTSSMPLLFRPSTTHASMDDPYQSNLSPGNILSPTHEDSRKNISPASQLQSLSSLRRPAGISSGSSRLGTSFPLENDPCPKSIPISSPHEYPSLAEDTMAPDPPNREFPQFRELPAELRHMIWRFALPGPRILEARRTVEIYRSQLTSVEPKSTPLLSACHESRQIALRTYSKVSADFLVKPFYANIGKDVVLIHNPTLKRWVGKKLFPTAASISNPWFRPQKISSAEPPFSMICNFTTAFDPLRFDLPESIDRCQTHFPYSVRAAAARFAMYYNNIENVLFREVVLLRWEWDPDWSVGDFTREFERVFAQKPGGYPFPVETKPVFHMLTYQLTEDGSTVKEELLNWMIERDLEGGVSK